jgi:uncharacterized membrane protein YphA (DoxX/SURF4 family)
VPATREETWLGLRPLAAEQRATPQLVRRAYLTLRFGLCTLFAVTGFDKFAQVLTRWPDQVAPELSRVTAFGPYLLTRLAGLAEIAAALLCAVRPRIGGWVLAGWLAGAVMNRLMLGQGYDVAMKDGALALAAVALARLAAYYER